MLHLETTRFGAITVPEDKVITFVHGIPGFDRLRRYILVDHDSEGLFKWLQSVDDPRVAFLMTDPDNHKPGYNVPISKSDMKGLGATDAEGVVVLVMVCVSDDANGKRTVTINLKGPVLFNASSMKALQCIVDKDDYEAGYVIN